MTLIPNINRQVELFLCDQLSSVITDVSFLPEQGFAGKPPLVGNEALAVPLIIEATQIHPPAEVYMVEVHLALQTNPDDFNSDFHSDAIRRIQVVLQKIKGVTPGYNAARNLWINGMFISSVRPVLGDTTHTTVIEMRIGCQSMIYPAATPTWPPSLI